MLGILLLCIWGLFKSKFSVISFLFSTKTIPLLFFSFFVIRTEKNLANYCSFSAASLICSLACSWVVSMYSNGIWLGNLPDLQTDFSTSSHRKAAKIFFKVWLLTVHSPNQCSLPPPVWPFINTLKYITFTCNIYIYQQY